MLYRCLARGGHDDDYDDDDDDGGGDDDGCDDTVITHTYTSLISPISKHYY